MIKKLKIWLWGGIGISILNICGPVIPFLTIIFFKLWHWCDEKRGSIIVPTIVWGFTLSLGAYLHGLYGLFCLYASIAALVGIFFFVSFLKTYAERFFLSIIFLYCFIIAYGFVPVFVSVLLGAFTLYGTIHSILYIYRAVPSFEDKVLFRNWCFFLPLLLCICFLLCIRMRGVYNCTDILHPVYELSIGKTVLTQIWEGNFFFEDYSFVGKPLRFHFLSTIISPFLIQIFGLNDLQTVYVIQPAFFLIIFTWLVSIFNLTSKWAIGLLPLMVITALNDGLLGLTILSDGSYFLGAIWLLLLLILYGQQRNISLFVAALFLLLIKAPYFLVFVGGLFFLEFINLYKRWKTQKLLIGAINGGLITAILLILSFFPLYYFFLSGAHQQNLWVCIPLIFATQVHIPGGIFSHEISFLQNIFIFAISIFSSYLLFNRTEQNRTEQNRTEQYFSYCL